jgi:hypothetical protein
MNEQEFIESIDFIFPYKDENKYMALINQARDISANASFMILHEIVRAPEEISIELRENLYNKWLNGFSHKLLPAVSEAAKSMLSDKELSVGRAMELMGQFKTEAGQYCALSIVYFSCDDQEGKADDFYNEIIEHWEIA